MLSITRHTADTEALIVDFIPGTLSTDSVDGVEVHLAATYSVLQDLVDSTPNHTVTSGISSVSSGAGTYFCLRVVSGLTLALSADSVDHEEGSGTGALSSDDVVDLVGWAGDATDAEIGIVEGGSRALLADGADEVVAGLADADSTDEESVDV